MIATSGAFTASVLSVDYYGAWRVQITLPAAAAAYQDVTLAVESVSVQAQTTTDMPEGSRLQVGYPAISCDVTVSGLVDRTDASKTAGWLFSPYSTTSPLYRSDVLYAAVTVDFGVYTATSAGTPEWVRKFTGVVDDYTVSEDGAVAFTCIDAMRSRLRSVPAIPAVVTAPPFSAGLTSEFAIDALLRAATKGAVSSWPARRPQCVLAVGMRSSLWPEIGTLDTATRQPTPTFNVGVFGTALTSLVTNGSGTAVVYNLSGGLGDDIFIEAWLNGSPGSATVQLNASGPTGDFAELLVTGTGLTFTVGHGSTYTWVTTLGAGSHYVSAKVHSPVGSASWSVTFELDGVTNSSGTIVSPHTRADTLTSFFAGWDPLSGFGSSLEALQVTTETAPASNRSFVPLAVLDPSLNTLTVVPAIDPGDPSAVIQQIAAAELGNAGGDESAIFRFYNRTTIRGVTSQRDITSATSLSGIDSIEQTAAGVINRATVEYTPWTFAATNSIVWSSTAAIRVARGSTKTVTATSDAPFASITSPFTVLADNSTDVTASHYRASTDRYGTAEHPGVTITAVQTSSTTAVITIVNRANQDAWLVSPANYTDATAYPVGTPVLQLAGLAVTQGDALTQDVQYPFAADGGGAVSRFGEQATQISGNPWLQDDDTAYELAVDIVSDQATPRPNVTGVAIVPDPRIQLIDVVHLIDSDRTAVDEYVRVFGWSITWEAGDPMTYTMTIDARTLAAPSGWIMGVAGRSEIGSTAYVYPSV